MIKQRDKNLRIVYRVLEYGISFTHGINVYNKERLNIFDSHDNCKSLKLDHIIRGIIKLLLEFQNIY